jgi:hypothetical protein
MYREGEKQSTAEIDVGSVATLPLLSEGWMLFSTFAARSVGVLLAV